MPKMSANELRARLIDSGSIKSSRENAHHNKNSRVKTPAPISRVNAILARRALMYVHPKI